VLDAGAPGDAGTARVPVFIAQGEGGRTTLSCDDGRTWVGNRSWDLQGDPLVCGSTQAIACYTDTCSYLINGTCQQRTCCNDTPDNAKGIAYGGGAFVATWGWGSPGAVRRSTNGLDWTTTLPDDTFGGVAYGSGHFVVSSRFPFLSGDGVSWDAGQTANYVYNGMELWSVRSFAYSEYGGGRFVGVASGNGLDVMVSSDDGDTWWQPTVLPAGCGNGVGDYGSIVSGNGVIVMVGEDGNACRSEDGGKTWSVAPTGAAQVLSRGVWTGSEFMFWGDDAYRLTSADGATWTKTAMLTPLRLGPVARSPGGTLVAAGPSVYTGYAQQKFWRSTDGLTWDALPPGSFVPSHPIFHIAFGYVDPSPTCPLP
jgi:hypothetical protein